MEMCNFWIVSKIFVVKRFPGMEFLQNAGEWAERDCSSNRLSNPVVENKKNQFKVLDKPLKILR
jgi:hypothetical protein